jgi:hypothetical protein
MVSENQRLIQQHLLQYLNEEVELFQFEDWFMPFFWNIENCDASTQEMAGRIHVLISEMSLGDRSVESTKEELANTILPLVKGRSLKGISNGVLIQGVYGTPLRPVASVSSPIEMAQAA